MAASLLISTLGKNLALKTILPIYSVCHQQIRNTFILKRRKAPLLNKIGQPPRRLRKGHFVYDLVEDTNVKKQDDIKVILMDYVEGIGLKGEVVSVRPNVARYKLLLPRLAVYASPENLAKYKQERQEQVEKTEHSSLYSEMTAKFLSRSIAMLTMNMDHPWTIEKFHVKIALRKAGIIVPEYAITLPEEPISGPDLNLEGKIFLATIKINSCETVTLRCRINHWTSDASRTLPRPQPCWESLDNPVFPETLDTLKSLPAPPKPKSPTTAN